MSESGYVFLVSYPNRQGNQKIGLTSTPPERMKQLGGDECTVLAMVLCSDPFNRDNKSSRIKLLITCLLVVERVCIQLLHT